MAFESIKLNLIPDGEKPIFHAAQFDIGRPLIIEMYIGEDAYTIPNDIEIELQVRKVDNNIVTAAPDTVDGNTITFLTTEQMTACSGTNLCEIQFTIGDQTIATLHFYLVVQRDVLAGGLTSQSEIYDLEEQIAAIVPSVIGDEYYTAEEVDEKIAEIPTFDPTNYYTKSQLYTKTETNGLLSQKANISSLATVATSGSYNDLLNKPTIPDVSNYYTKSETYSQNEVNTLLSTKADVSALSAVATTGSYDDLTDKPTIPTNAEQLPIESGSATNTKDYIDSVKTDLSDNVITEAYKTITSGDISPDSGLSLYSNNQVYRLGRFCLLTISVKINRSISGSCSITNYIPNGYRPLLEISAVVENGLGDGKAQPIKIGTDGKLTIYPITLNTNTYAIGTVFYPLAIQ